MRTDSLRNESIVSSEVHGIQFVAVRVSELGASSVSSLREEGDVSCTSVLSWLDVEGNEV